MVPGIGTPEAPPPSTHLNDRSLQPPPQPLTFDASCDGESCPAPPPTTPPSLPLRLTPPPPAPYTDSAASAWLRQIKRTLTPVFEHPLCNLIDSPGSRVDAHIQCQTPPPNPAPQKQTRGIEPSISGILTRLNQRASLLTLPSSFAVCRLAVVPHTHHPAPRPGGSGWCGSGTAEGKGWRGMGGVTCSFPPPEPLTHLQGWTPPPT